MDASLGYQVRGQILGGDTISPFASNLPRVVLLWVTPLLLSLMELRTLRWLPGVVAEAEAVVMAAIQGEIVDAMTSVHGNALIVAR